jgi:type I restriction enzyme S subunit
MRKPYSSYKDSGVEWIGNIPKHWATNRLKYLSEVYSSTVDRYIYDDEIQVSVCHYPDVYNNEFVNEDTLLNKGSCNQVEFERFQLEKGLVILTKDSETPDDIGIPCFIEKNLSNVVCGYHLSIIKTNNNHINRKFLFRFIQSDKVRCHFEVHSKGIIRFSIGKSIIENLFVNLPPLPEQQQIVKYLDNRTKLIDELIEKTKQKIELLKEKRTSLINHCVTKGLNPDVEMKDSGIEWIGKIPKHWIVSKFKYLSIITTGNTPSKNYENIYYTDAQNGYLWIKPTSLNKGFNYVIESEEYLTEEGKKQTRLIPKDSIMICCIGNTIGKYGISGKELSTNQQINTVIPNQNLINPLFCLFYVDVFTRDLFKLANFVTLPIYTKSDLENTPFILPPADEQIEIVNKIKGYSQFIDTLIEKENKRIELLKEYRQSLISEAVTGKIDVRDEVAI